MQFLQINLNHCEVAQSLLEQNVIEKIVDMALITEQYKNKNFGEWLANNSKKSAIWSCGNPRRQIRGKRGNCFYSIIYLTFVSAELASGCSWEVRGTYMVTDHAAIF